MGLQMAGSLVWFWTWFIQHGLGHELFEYLMKILSRADAQGPILERAKALNAVGFISWTQNRFEDARLSLEEALSIGRRFQDKATLAWTLGYLGAVLTGLGELGQAKALLKEGLEMSRQLGQPAKVIAGLALTFLGDIAYAQADDNSARNFYEEGSLFLQEGHDLNLLAYTNRKLGYLTLRQGDTLKALPLFQSSLSINYELRHQLGFTAALAGLGALAVAQKRLTRAAQLFGIVDARLIFMNTHLFSSDEAEYLRGIKKLRGDLTDKILSKYWARGKSMTMEEVMEFALKET
jgi:tetratricopeptide (TPR) repeat protein